MTVAEYVTGIKGPVSHREHRAWCFYKEILRMPKKQATLPDGTPYGPRPVTKTDIARINKINWQRQVAGVEPGIDPKAQAIVKSAAEHRKRVRG